MSLEYRFLKVVTEEAVGMSDGRSFHAVYRTGDAKCPVAETSSGTRDDKVSTSCRIIGVYRPIFLGGLSHLCPKIFRQGPKKLLC